MRTFKYSCSGVEKLSSQIGLVQSASQGWEAKKRPLIPSRPVWNSVIIHANVSGDRMSPFEHTG